MKLGNEFYFITDYEGFMPYNRGRVQEISIERYLIMAKNNNNQKLELTWIGKGEEPKLEPRILIESPKVKERKMALGLFLDKFSPDDKMDGKRYAEKLFERTKVIRLDINKWTGKCNRIH